MASKTVDFKAYVVPNSQEPGYTSIYRNIKNKDSLLPVDFADVKTMYDVFWSSSRAENLGAGIVSIMTAAAQSDTEREAIIKRNWPVGIYSINRPEWGITERALATQSLYSVALYDTLGESSMEYILNHSEAAILVCSVDKVHKLLSNKHSLPLLKVIVCMDSVHSDGSASYIPPPFNVNSVGILKRWAESLDIKFYDFKQVEQIGLESKIPHYPPKPSDIYTLMYTSGTTGNPKGAVSTHFSYASASVCCNHGIPIKTDGMVYISYLPLAHCYGRNSENFTTLAGGIIGYFCGDITKILDDCQALQPTYFPGVPRLLMRFYDLISANTINAPGFKGMVCRMAIDQKIQNMHNNKGLSHFVWDRLIFNKIKALFGGKLELVGSGSAPLEPRVMDFFRVVLCCQLLEGYGMTETSAIGSMQPDGDLTSGNIGVLTYGMEARLRDVPEMKYFSTDKPCGRGELCIRGPSIFSGYFKDQEKTDEALIGDGWLATGDICRMNIDGTITIIDRKKNIFKLSQGEYLAPEKIENVLAKDSLSLQTFVHGYSSKNYPVAIIVPNPDTFIPWVQKLELSNNAEIKQMNFEQLCRNKEVKKEFLDRMTKVSKAAKLQGFETIKAVHLEHVPFDIEENKLLTPTLKLKRFDAAERYKDVIHNLYDEF
ncbi:hypothetical protein BB561_002953 [Smittium simulii]|uniref:AMP-dependent synthetase/ligase domain-containing protein n=1 Tax=Smittium simulii TaxID=133385 RepID=A0A2T9YNI5_9FUNG|nr:hypothetical protein BB561_002953 [Smittium simulii]